MNKFINAVLIFLLLPTMLLTIIVGFDLPISMLHTTGREFPYHEEIFLGIGLFVLVMNVRRSIRRWMGARIVSKKDRFKWNQTVSDSRRKRVITYTLLEALVMTFVSIALYVVTPKALLPAIAFLYAAVDNLIFLAIGLNRGSFRVGLSSKALVVADRDVVLLYFTGLRKVSIHQQTIYFDYIKNLQLSFPLDCVNEDSQTEFFDQLKDQLDTDKVFFSKVS